MFASLGPRPITLLALVKSPQSLKPRETTSKPPTHIGHLKPVNLRLGVPVNVYVEPRIILARKNLKKVGRNRIGEQLCNILRY